MYLSYMHMSAKAFDRVYLEWDEQKEQIWHDMQTHLIYLLDRARIFGFTP